MNKNVPGAKYLSTTTWVTQEHYNFCCNGALFVPGAMEQNSSDLFCSRVAGTFHLLRATFLFFNLKKKMTMRHDNFFRCVLDGKKL